MSGGAVAERYAQAIFELGSENGELHELTEKLAVFSSVYESSQELRLTLSNPTVSTEDQREVLTQIAKRVSVSELGIRALLVIAARGRLSALSAIVSRLSQLSDEKNGILRARVTTACEMPESYFQKLSAEMAAGTKKKVVLEQLIDSDLVAGTITQIGDQVIDGSLRGRLERAERELLSAIVSQTSALS